MFKQLVFRVGKWVFLILAIVIFGKGFDSFVALIKPAVDLYATDPGDLRRNMHIDAQLKEVRGSYIAAADSKDIGFDNLESQYKFYLVPLESKESGEIKFLAVQCMVADYEEYDRLTEQTLANLKSGNLDAGAYTVRCNGRLHAVNSNMSKNFKAWFSENYSDKYTSGLFVPYYVEYVDKRKATTDTCILLAMVGIFIVWFAFSVKKTVNWRDAEAVRYGGNPEKLQKAVGEFRNGEYISNNSVMMEDLGEDYDIDGERELTISVTPDKPITNIAVDEIPEQVFIMGTAFKLVDLDGVNLLLKKGDIKAATEQLIKISNFGEEQAKSVIQSWKVYYTWNLEEVPSTPVKLKSPETPVAPASKVAPVKPSSQVAPVKPASSSAPKITR